jgi:hypothetical protein
MENRLAIDTTPDAPDPFANARIVSVEYDDANPERYSEGIFIGLVVKQFEDRMKVVFAYETGEIEIAWLSRHGQDRWIYKTWLAVVTVEDASKSQREAFRRNLSRERLAKILKSEGA